MKKKRILVLAAIALILLLGAWITWENLTLEVNDYTVESQRLPDGFDGFRIAQVSDLHNASFGKNNETLLTLLRETQPDMIAITGDLVDSRKTDIPAALAFVEQAVKIAPCYYVTGNHEQRLSECAWLKQTLGELGVTVLEEESVQLHYRGDAITLLGVNDPSFRTQYLLGDEAAAMAQTLEALPAGEGYTLLLSHRPEFFELYVKAGFDLVLSGHAHGGQFRLPFVGGVYVPSQGLFPEYDAGMFTQGTTSMIVSRGIGQSIVPVRINNPPELVVIELKCEKTMWEIT